MRRAALVIAALSVVWVVAELGLPVAAPHLASRIGGLTERLFLGTVLLWMAVVSAYLAMQAPGAVRAGPSTQSTS